MVTYVLDSSAVLRYLDNEAGAERVAEIIKGHLAGDYVAAISAIHWGEIAGVVGRIHGQPAAELALSRLMSFGLEVVPATAERAVRAAMIKVKTKIAYADAFGVQLATESREHILVTSDFGLKPAVHEVKIEFLPRK